MKTQEIENAIGYLDSYAQRAGSYDELMKAIETIEGFSAALEHCKENDLEGVRINYHAIEEEKNG